MLDAIALTLLISAAPAESPLQVLKSPAFERLLGDVDVRCPGSQVRYASPAALLDTEDAFAERLPRRDFLRLRHDTPAAPGGGTPCAQRDGATCPATATLMGLSQARLRPRFVRFVCARGDKPWS